MTQAQNFTALLIEAFACFAHASPLQSLSLSTIATCLKPMYLYVSPRLHSPPFSSLFFLFFCLYHLHRSFAAFFPFHYFRILCSHTIRPCWLLVTLRSLSLFFQHLLVWTTSSTSSTEILRYHFVGIVGQFLTTIFCSLLNCRLVIGSVVFITPLPLTALRVPSSAQHEQQSFPPSDFRYFEQ